jgi:hypothetical protein
MLMAKTTKELMEPFAKHLMGTPVAIAPERKHELWEDVVRREKWTFELHEGRADYFADTGDHVVAATYAGLAALWCLAYMSYQMMDLLGTAQQIHGGRKDSPPAVDIGGEWKRLNLKAYLDYAEQLMVADAPWPEGLEQPNARAPFRSVPGRINNTFLGAVAFILLHEVAHVHHRDVNDNRLRWMQEDRADRFAARWMLDKAGKGRKREFRIVMITIALLYIFFMERRWGPTAMYPTAYERLEAASRYFHAGKRSGGLSAACGMLKAVLDPKTRPPKLFDTIADNFNWIMGRLKEMSPAAPLSGARS